MTDTTTTRNPLAEALMARADVTASVARAFLAAASTVTASEGAMKAPKRPDEAHPLTVRLMEHTGLDEATVARLATAYGRVFPGVAPAMQGIYRHHCQGPAAAMHTFAAFPKDIPIPSPAETTRGGRLPSVDGEGDARCECCNAPLSTAMARLGYARCADHTREKILGDIRELRAAEIVDGAEEDDEKDREDYFRF